MKILRVESCGRRSLAIVTTDGIVTAVIAEYGPATVPDDEVEVLRMRLVKAFWGLVTSP